MPRDRTLLSTHRAFATFGLVVVCVLVAVSPASAATPDGTGIQDASAEDNPQTPEPGGEVTRVSCSEECRVGLSLASIFPLGSDRVRPDQTDPEVLDVDDDRAGELIEALTSETARTLLHRLDEKPLTASELAGEVDTSLQNVHYHLENLEDAGAIAEIDIEYSERGREMSVYAAVCRPRFLLFETS